MLSLDSHILILGFGREGEAAYSYLKSNGYVNVTVFDEDAERLKSIDASVIVNPLSTLDNIQVLIVSPGIPKTHGLVSKARSMGIQITTSTNLFLERNADKTIGVTGSKGKSTTSSLIAHILKQSGYNVALGGNIGLPLLGLPEADIYVAELSSYQNAYITNSPSTVVVTSLFPDHADWHGGVEEYYRDKLNLIGSNTKSLIVNKYDNTLMQFVKEKAVSPMNLSYEYSPNAGAIVRGDEEVVKASELSLIGQHNFINIALALTACQSVVGELDLSVVRSALVSFQPLEHRLQIVKRVKHVFIDDTLATTAYSTAASLKAVDSTYPTLPVYLIVGGYDRGLPESDVLINAILNTPSVTVLTIPENGRSIVKDLEDKVKLVHFDILEEAVAYTVHLPEGVVLLSPAASSYNDFTNYVEKSAAFMAAINRNFDK